MSDPDERVRALALAALVVFSAVAGTVALSGTAAAAANVAITPSDDAAGATDVTYTAEGEVELDNQDTLQYIDVQLSPADVSNVGSEDVSLYVDGNEFTDGFSQFSASDGTVEFKLSNSRSLSDGDPVRVVVSDVTNPADDFDASVTLHDTGDAEFQTFADTVSISSSPAISSYSVTNPTGQELHISFDSDKQLSEITVDITDSSGATVATLTESDFSETDEGSTWAYDASYTVETDGEYTATLSEAVDADGNDGADSESDTVTVDAVTTEITDASADPATVAPGSTVSNQEVTVSFSDVSADGDTDWYYVEFPNALADGLSVNGASADTTSITSSPNLVEGYDDDGVDDTVKFATSADGGGTIPVSVTADVSVDYPDTATTYGVDARIEDSDGDDVSGTDVASIEAADTSAPILTDLVVTNPSDRTVQVSFDASEQLSTIGVDLTDSEGTTVATLTESDFSETDEGSTWAYEATYTVDSDGEYTATVTEAVDADGNDGADGESDTVYVETTPATIVGGSASPAEVDPGETVDSQQVTVTVDDVSADGDTDWHYVEFPNALADGLSVDSASVDGTSIESSANLVEGYDNDGVDDTVKFGTSATGGGDVDLSVSVDVSVSYPDTERSYAVDSRTVDSRIGAVTQSNVATIEATASSGGGGGGGDDDNDGGGGYYGSDAPDVVGFDLQRDGQAVDVRVVFDDSVSELAVNVSGPVDETLTKSNFTASERDGNTVYTANVSDDVAGEFTVELETAANADGDGADGQTDTVVVGAVPSGDEVTGIAAPPWVGESDSSHTYTVTIPENASVANETLDGVTVGYSEPFRNESGSVSSVSDDQNVAVLSVVAANGSTKARLGGTDAVSVNVVGGEVRLDLSDVDSSRAPTVLPGDSVVVSIRPVTNPSAAGEYDTSVVLEGANGHNTTAETTVAIRPAVDAEATASEHVGPNDGRASLALNGSVVESLVVTSDLDTASRVSARVPAEQPDAVDQAPGTVLTTVNVTRSDGVEDSPVSLRFALSADAVQHDAETLTVVHYDDETDEWSELDTDVVSQSDGTVTLEANASHTSLFAVSADDSNEQMEDTPADTTTVAPTTADTSDSTDEPTTSTSSPGFTVGAALVALAAAALLAAHRRD